eukprot:CAMPEP_0185039310 /NCGR_PEP_ID=MMETSP1103-20130426/36042_1 /TAXON_ID=36769 /ORGANISM="Paraphysomonas bandaiensis, Strain Caron Lab Isolate" /LENGTH=187 /DNA_ID=CAMNT_0027578147 /DNA_START=242 /DNA_END=805 /DNA_ORIENTATION=+
MAGYSHVLVIRDNVVLDSSFDVYTLLQIMKRNHLSVVSPEICTVDMDNNSSSICGTGKGIEEGGYTTHYIPLLASMYSIEAWGCQWDLFDPGLNPSGWGCDRYFYHYCSQQVQDLRLGITTKQHVTHLSYLPKDRPSYPTIPDDERFRWRLRQKSIKEQAKTWLEHFRSERGVTLERGKPDRLESLV